MTQEDPALERARKRVKELSGFIDRNGGANSGFLGLDWAYWVIIFWGFGVAGHAVSTYFGEYQVHKLYEKEKSRRL